MTSYISDENCSKLMSMGAAKLSRSIKANQPTVTSGKDLVTVKAAGVNPADLKIGNGGLQQLVLLQFPSTLGMDFSGVIKQVGEGKYREEVFTK